MLTSGNYFYQPPNYSAVSLRTVARDGSHTKWFVGD